MFICGYSDGLQHQDFHVLIGRQRLRVDSSRLQSATPSFRNSSFNSQIILSIFIFPTKPMDPSDPFDLNNVVKWYFDNVINDNSKEEMMRIILEKQREEQAGSSTRRTGKRRHIERNREEGHTRLFNDYFSEQPVYTDEQFRRRFRMSKHVFLRNVQALGEHDEYFQLRVDGCGRQGLSPLQKCTSAIRMLAYASPADSLDDYVRMGESTSVECLEKFTSGVIKIFGEEYLRRPTTDDIQRLLQIGNDRGFPGMLGSIDCMHWEWKNCPVAWQGQFSRGDHGNPTVMLEAVASKDLWIWHAFFGVAGSNNDINVLNQSPVFNDILHGRAPEVKYTVNGTEYNLGYYLADGIYFEWATFVKTIPMPQGEKRQFFAKQQEGARKDIERAFGVLQARFAIVRCPSRQWQLDSLARIMYACIILHNMIVEDERDTYGGNFDYSDVGNDTVEESNNGRDPDIQDYLQRRFAVRDRVSHHQLKADLVEHVWEHHRHMNDQN
ncbi:hypothetical protein RIF29_38001 [Crotalaria pallida]|uniref:Uncharacterized protein n=1 Tax=Crotalaria pallida TaxID=3830 RepID=A0AAN9HNI0_CROPI